MDAQAWTNVGVALGTFVLAAVTVVLAYQTRRSVNTAEEQADISRAALAVAQQQSDLTRRAVEAAELQVAEAAKARVDSRSARVVVLPGSPEWPPYLEVPWQSNPAQAEPGTVYTLPAHSSQRLWFRIQLLLRNEGSLTGFVRLQKEQHADDVRFEAGLGPFSSDEYFDAPQAIGQERYVLAPGQTALVVLDASKSVGELATAWTDRALAPPESMMRLRIVVSDHLEDGIIDETEVVVQVYPLEPVEGNAAGWAVRRQPLPQVPVDVGLMSVSVMDTQRRRRTLEAT